MSTTKDTVTIVEVGPRDGLQNERQVLDPATRARFVRSLLAAGLRRIEVASFVDPRRVPQMGGAEEVLGLLGDRPSSASFIGLVLNEKGARRAIATQAVDELNMVVPVTDRFGTVNQGTTTDAALMAAARIRDLASDSRMRFSISLAVAFGCPYEGVVPLARLMDVARQAAALEPDELAVADTIGCAVPRQVGESLAALAGVTDAPLRVHFHETRHTGLANVQAALAAGVRSVDSSAAGLGGCPFAPGAAGNIATEDLAWMLARSGHPTRVDLNAVTQAGLRVCESLGVASRSGLSSAGPFPPLGADVSTTEPA